MTIDPFDEDLSNREILPYDPVYREVFASVREYVESRIPTVELVHIGSTAISDLRGKPMLDVAAVSTCDDLRDEQRSFERIGFHRRDVWVDRDDKPYVCGSVARGGKRYNINIHICHHGDSVHLESLAFIQILERRPDLRREYERAKVRAHAIDPVDAEAYNRAKEAVILQILDKAREPDG